MSQGDYKGPPDGLANYYIIAAIEYSREDDPSAANAYNRQLLDHYIDRRYVIGEDVERALWAIERLR